MGKIKWISKTDSDQDLVKCKTNSDQSLVKFVLVGGNLPSESSGFS